MDTHDKFWYLNRINLFEGVSDTDIMDIAHNMTEKECFRKEILYTPYENVQSIYLLKKGEITIYYSHEGKKLVLETLSPGSLFGNLNFQENKSPHFAEVSKDAFVCIFSQQDFMNIFAKRPELVLKLFQYTAERMGEYEGKMKGLILNAKEKVLHHLNFLSQKQQRFLGIFTKRTLRISHEKLAEGCGLSRETVTRALQELKKESLIDVDTDGKIILK